MSDLPGTLGKVTTLLHDIRDLVGSIEPHDDLAREHRDRALIWLESTGDVFRREKPSTPSPHLVSYFVPVDRAAGRALIGAHNTSGLWLPPGGHVEPGEDPVDTVRRECREELGIEATFDDAFTSAGRPRPAMVTVTRTVGEASARHTDVSLWFVLDGCVGMPIVPDPREFAEMRWWSRQQVVDLRDRFDPHQLRMFDALGIA